MTKVNQDNQGFYSYFLGEGIEVWSVLSRLYSQRNLEHIDWSWLSNPDSKEYKVFEARVLFHQANILANKKVIGELINKAKSVINIINDHQQKLK